MLLGIFELAEEDLPISSFFFATVKGIPLAIPAAVFLYSAAVFVPSFPGSAHHLVAVWKVEKWQERWKLSGKDPNLSPEYP